MGQGNRQRIAIFGRVNSGKSTLFNRLLDEKISIVSPLCGTTTDSVSKVTELSDIGAVTVTDTAGYDDDSALGRERVAGTEQVLASADIALLVIRGRECADIDREWIDKIKERNIPCVTIYNIDGAVDSIQSSDELTVYVNAESGKGIDSLRDTVIKVCEKRQISLFGDLVSQGDTVLLVMPQDSGAPSGRMILPQSMAIRELIDRGAVGICADLSTLPAILSKWRKDISLVVTDSSVFDRVYEQCGDMRITSFSVLFARTKGDIDVLAEGANAVDRLDGHSRIILIEACSHVTSHEDIGRVKIPAMLRKRLGDGITVDFVRSGDGVPNVTGCDLAVHCGGCMLTDRIMRSRLASIKKKGIPVTNYGLLIAKLSGILDKIVW